METDTPTVMEKPKMIGKFNIVCNNYSKIMNAMNYFREQEGPLELANPHLRVMDSDYLYHLSLGNHTHDLVELFGDVKASIIYSIL